MVQIVWYFSVFKSRVIARSFSRHGVLYKGLISISSFNFSSWQSFIILNRLQGCGLSLRAVITFCSNCGKSSTACLDILLNQKSQREWSNSKRYGRQPEKYQDADFVWWMRPRAQLRLSLVCNLSPWFQRFSNAERLPFINDIRDNYKLKTWRFDALFFTHHLQLLDQTHTHFSRGEKSLIGMENYECR